ncbi:MAG TPA: hypothetical protein VMV40_01685 [Acidiferrobacter sp.]|nr:hypothetical protein [Acidiferrobacter sp.]
MGHARSAGRIAAPDTMGARDIETPQKGGKGALTLTRNTGLTLAGHGLETHESLDAFVVYEPTLLF